VSLFDDDCVTHSANVDSAVGGDCSVCYIAVPYYSCTVCLWTTNWERERERETVGSHCLCYTVSSVVIVCSRASLCTRPFLFQFKENANFETTSSLFVVSLQGESVYNHCG